MFSWLQDFSRRCGSENEKPLSETEAGRLRANQHNSRYEYSISGNKAQGVSSMFACKKCLHYNGRFCTKDWNNLEEDYLITERDEVDPDDFCDEYESYEEEVQ